MENGLFVRWLNHTILIQDIDGIFDPYRYNDFKRDIFDLFGDEDRFMIYKNACLVDSKTWSLFIKSGKELLKQIDETGIANKLKIKGSQVYLLDAEYFKNEYKKSYLNYEKSKKTAKDREIFYESILTQVRDITSAMVKVVNTNNKNAYSAGILSEEEIEIKAIHID